LLGVARALHIPAHRFGGSENAVDDQNGQQRDRDADQYFDQTAPAVPTPLRK
jgi:hypothetical protein